MNHRAAQTQEARDYIGLKLALSSGLSLSTRRNVSVLTFYVSLSST